MITYVPKKNNTQGVPQITSRVSSNGLKQGKQTGIAMLISKNNKSDSKRSTGRPKIRLKNNLLILTTETEWEADKQE